MKTIYVIGMVLLLMSCSSKQDKIVKECEKFLKQEMNDPDSYERASYEFIDTAYFSETIKNEIGMVSIKSYIDSYEPKEDLPPPPPPPTSKPILKKIKIDVGNFIIEKTVIDSSFIIKQQKTKDSLISLFNDIKNHPEKDYVVAYKLGIKFRHNNIMGAKILNGQIFIYRVNPGKNEPKIETLLKKSY